MGLGLHGSGILPIVLLVAAVIGGAYYLGRQAVQRRNARFRGDHRKPRS